MSCHSSSRVQEGERRLEEEWDSQLLLELFRRVQWIIQWEDLQVDLEDLLLVWWVLLLECLEDLLLDLLGVSLVHPHSDSLQDHLNKSPPSFCFHHIGHFHFLSYFGPISLLSSFVSPLATLIVFSTTQNRETRIKGNFGLWIKKVRFKV